MADIDKVETTVRQIVCDVLNKKPDQVTPEANLSRDLDMRSMEFLDLYEALDKEFNIDMDDEANEIQTFGDLVRYIKSRMTGGADAVGA
ncbi:MAG TPA: phosphopantetheine-binding protein [Candidatus Bathyarchaeia archaeon]|nr:phosphopantetheine-binding protein [Candidatus Bathyarchaeia archaeon]